jgi:hypothetical protein
MKIAAGRVAFEVEGARPAAGSPSRRIPVRRGDVADVRRERFQLVVGQGYRRHSPALHPSGRMMEDAGQFRLPGPAPSAPAVAPGAALSGAGVEAPEAGGAAAEAAEVPPRLARCDTRPFISAVFKVNATMPAAFILAVGAFKSAASWAGGCWLAM